MVAMCIKSWHAGFKALPRLPAEKITHVISLGSENWCYVSAYWLAGQIEWKYLCKNAWKTHNVA